MPIFRAEIKAKNGKVTFDDFTADTPSQALDMAAEKHQEFREIRVPHLTSLQKITEWLKTINERFENE